MNPHLLPAMPMNHQHRQHYPLFRGAVGWDEQIRHGDAKGVGDGVEVVEGDVWLGWGIRLVAAFHGEDDGFGEVAEVCELLAGEFVKDA